MPEFRLTPSEMSNINQTSNRKVIGLSELNQKQP